MHKILSDEMYEQAGKEVDRKLAPMQKVIFEQARRKAMKEPTKDVKKLFDEKFLAEEIERMKDEPEIVAMLKKLQTLTAWKGINKLLKEGKENVD